MDIQMDGIEDNEMFADINQIDGAAQKIMTAMKSTPAPVAHPIATQQVVQQAGVVAAPPSQAKLTEEDKQYEEYKKEKEELYTLTDQLSKLANSDTNGEIVRNFGMSQLAISISNEIVRLNGLVILRALKAKCKERSQDKKNDKITTDKAGYVEAMSQSLYEVWGEMEDGSLGLTSSYLPGHVVSVIDLHSGYDISPDE